MLNMPFKGWSLGIYLAANRFDAMLLQWSWGRAQYRGYWSHECAQSEQGSLQTLLRPIAKYLSALNQTIELVVNLGLPHQQCAWQPLPDGGPVMWQRHAAMHWQLDPSQVYLDVLPIAPQVGLLVSTPCQTVSAYMASIHQLQALTKRPLRINLETDVTSVLKIWPWRLRQTVVLAAWQSGDNSLFVDLAGLHVCANRDMPADREHYLVCSKVPADLPQAQLEWFWQLHDLPADALLAWHLAYVSSWSMPWGCRLPWVAWQSRSKLTSRQYLSLVSGFAMPFNAARL